MDATQRSAQGIRIALPGKGGTPVTPAVVRAALERARAGQRKLRRVRERPRTRYGAGWAGPPEAEPPGSDVLRTLEYVVVDVETTGGAADRGHRITEVCAVRMSGNGRVTGEFATLLNPERPIPPAVSALTRITQAMVESAPRFADVAGELRTFLNGSVFVAHNAAFDWGFIGVELERAGLAAPTGRVLCTVRLARKVVPEVSRRSLDALSWYFGVPNEARHRAFGDARATARIFSRLLDRVDEREIRCWSELETLLRRRTPRRKRRASPEPMRDA